jgi:GNAT superfamily N-acetyltransferase
MISIEVVDTSSSKQVNEFIMLPFRLYDKTPQWVPLIRQDARTMMNRDKHPFFEHSEAEFFVARDGQEVVGTLAVLENKPYNKVHEKKSANFYLFESVDDIAVATALFERAYEWAREHGLNRIVGPKGFSIFDGYGLQVEGFEHRRMMFMMNYNHPYYVSIIESLGFTKEVDFVSKLVTVDRFRMPEKVHEVARRLQQRGSFEVKNFTNKRELIKWGHPIGRLYNDTFMENWEYTPLTEREVQFAVDNVLMMADPRLIKLILHKDEPVGFLFAFPDVSAAIKRHKGRLTPWALADLLIEMRRTKMVAFNGGGVLPKFHGRGGNALLYTEMEKTIHQYNYDQGEFTQVAESAVQMRKDIATLGGIEYKNHRVYQRDI